MLRPFIFIFTQDTTDMFCISPYSRKKKIIRCRYGKSSMHSVYNLMLIGNEFILYNRKVNCFSFVNAEKTRRSLNLKWEKYEKGKKNPEIHLIGCQTIQLFIPCREKVTHTYCSKVCMKKRVMYLSMPLWLTIPPTSFFLFTHFCSWT